MDSALAAAIERRKQLAEAEKAGLEALGPLPSDLEEFWTDVQVRDGWRAKTMVVRPKSGTASHTKRPLIVFFYGGGFRAGTPNMVARPARDFASKFNAVVCCPSYRLCPENSWPIPMKDGWDVASYLSKHAHSELGATLRIKDGGGFVIRGVSAGASIAAVIAGISLFRPKEVNEDQLVAPITGIFLGIPLLLRESIVPRQYKDVWVSREENKDKSITSAGLDMVLDGLQADERSPWFSPVNAIRDSVSDETPGQHANDTLCLYVQVGQYDPLRDDGVVLEKIFKDRGFATKLDIFPNNGHAAWTTLHLENESNIPPIGKTTMAGMEWLLDGP